MCIRCFHIHQSVFVYIIIFSLHFLPFYHIYVWVCTLCMYTYKLCIFREANYSSRSCHNQRFRIQKYLCWYTLLSWRRYEYVVLTYVENDLARAQIVKTLARCRRSFSTFICSYEDFTWCELFALPFSFSHTAFVYWSKSYMVKRKCKISFWTLSWFVLNGMGGV